MRILTLILPLLFLTACATSKPRVLDYASVATGAPYGEMQYGIYLPPQWQAGERLPLILFLHGSGGSQFSLEDHKLNSHLDELISSGKVPRAIFVMPNGDNGFWENWHDGSHHYRQWILERVLPTVQKEYNTLGCPENCHLVGISMGGFGVLRFAYYARTLFSSVSSISAPIYSDQQANSQAKSLLAKLFFPLERIFGESPQEAYRASNPYNAWVDDPQLKQMRLQLVWGSRDRKSIIEANQAFASRLIENGLKFDKVVYAGGHKWRYWVPLFEQVMNFSLKP
jgi:enterochelin esterase-like enzyme